MYRVPPRNTQWPEEGNGSHGTSVTAVGAVWVLGTEPGSSAGAVKGLTAEPPPQPPGITTEFFFLYV